MPLLTDHERTKQRLRRLWDTKRIDRATPLHPMVKAALTRLRGQRVRRLLERVVVRHGQTALVVSAAFRKRANPLTWRFARLAGQLGESSNTRC